MLLHVLASSSRRQIPRVLALSTRKESSCLARIDVKNDKCPFVLFDTWLDEAKKHGAAIPLVYTLASSTKTGRVSSRILTVKDYVDGTFVSMLNLKRRNFEDNPNVAMVFYWCYKTSKGCLIARQVRMDACFEKLDAETSEHYFCTQPLYAQIRSIAYPQGEPVEWDELKRRHDELLRKVEMGKDMTAESESSDLAYIDIESIHSPFKLYQSWAEEATLRGVATPLVYNLATSTRSGRVTNRTIALTDYVDESFVSLLSRNSRKFEALSENPSVAMTFYWCYEDQEKRNVLRQVRIEGRLEELDEETSRRYFDAEPLFARIRSVICDQGKEVDWKELKTKHDEVLRMAEMGEKIEKPGYEVACRIVPDRFDFYYAFDQFIADRILAELVEGDWKMRRIAT